MSEDVKGMVFDIHRSSLHDGPGLRTSVFLKGCPLRCVWCHNPESQSGEVERGGSGKVYGREMSVSEVMDIVIRDMAYYEATGGGVTISGGEPTAQFEFCRALLAELKHVGINTCLDTCGAFPSKCVDELMPLVDLWHYDYKATGAETHRALTGVGNRLILENLTRLQELGARIRMRCPIVAGKNDSPAHLQLIDDLEDSGEFESVERLAYHDWGNEKYRDLGRVNEILENQN